MKKITFTLSIELFEQVQHLAKLNNCSIAEMTAELVEMGYLEKRLYPIKFNIGGRK